MTAIYQVLAQIARPSRRQSSRDPLAQGLTGTVPRPRRVRVGVGTRARRPKSLIKREINVQTLVATSLWPRDDAQRVCGLESGWPASWGHSSAPVAERA